METILKFVLDEQDDQTVVLPKGYKILNVGEQQGTLTMWVMVNTDSPTTECHIRIYGTCHSIRQVMGYENIYLGTVMMSSGLVWHLFELK